MKKSITAIVTILCSVAATQAFSQDVVGNRWRLQLGYNVSAPIGSFKNDFIDKTSFRGATGELRYIINPKFAVGLAGGYQDFYQKYPRAVYNTGDNENISAVLTNTMQLIPIMLRGTYFPTGEKQAFAKPFVSLGAGANVITYKQYLGEFGSRDNSARFAASAGAGVLIPFNKYTNGTGFTLGANYNYGAYNKNGIGNINSVSFNVGLAIELK